MKALVTGASRGIGRATAQRLAADGFDIAVHYHRNRVEAEAVAAGIAESGREAFVLEGDLGAPEEVRSMASTISSRWPELDAIVHNGGDYPRLSFDAATVSDFDRAFRVHVTGPALLTQLLLPQLRRSPHPSLVFVSSVLAFEGSPRGAPYAAAKAGVLGLARSLARELAPTVRVNVVAPGPIDTAILAGDTAERRRERLRAIPMERVGRPEEVADAIAYLASPRASYVTGATLHVNGGIRRG